MIVTCMPFESVHTVQAVWRDNRDISSPEVCFNQAHYMYLVIFHHHPLLSPISYKVLEKVLKEAGFPASQLLHQATTDSVKSQLFANTAR